MTWTPLPETGIVPHPLLVAPGETLSHVLNHEQIHKALNGTIPLPSLLVDGPVQMGASNRRIPVSINFNMDGRLLDPGADLVNKVGVALGTNLIGGFTGEASTGAPDPGFFFQANDYGLTGTTHGDIDGLTDFWGRLTETHNRTPGSVLNTQKSFAAQAFVDEPTAHTHDLFSAHIFGPAGLGTADNATTLRVDSPTVGTVQYAIYQAGGAKNLFGGSIYLSQTGNGLGGYLNIDIANGGVYGASIQAVAGQAVDLIRVMQAGGLPRFRIDKDGTIVTARNGAPVGSTLANNELAFWFDPTPGAAKLKIEAKNSAGTIVQGELALT